MVAAFSRYPHRPVSRLDFPGFLLASAHEVGGETAFVAGVEGVAALVGTVAYQGHAPAPPVDGLWQAWQATGVACLQDLEGAFTAAVYDARAHRLTVANDKFGMRPLWVVQAGEYLAFCNELEPLLHLPGFSFSLHLEAVADYFCLGTTLGGETFAQGIRNLPPATALEITREAAQERNYWKAHIAIDRACGIQGHAERIAEVMRVVVPQLFDQLTHVHCLLSAGADSRLLLSCMTPAQRQRQLFLTSRLSTVEPAQDRDVRGALLLRDHLGLQHRVLEVALAERDFGLDYFDEVRQRRVAKIVGGWHGGEYLGGCCAQVAPIRGPLAFADVDARLRSIFSRKFRRQLTRHPHEHGLAALAGMEAENRSFHFQLDQMARSFFTSIYLGSRGSWLQPFEIINQGFSPFWDSRFLQALLAVPFDWVADYHLYNVLFRDHFHELAHIPSNSPLTLRPDTSLPPMTEGIEPKAALQPRYQAALSAFIADPATWQRGMYRNRWMRRTVRDGHAPATRSFIDFEAWWRRYGG